ncbi:hypothetical protein [Hoeflea alexandrii]|uniref:hypothetical protein n=1 Tax=Hoeflea alexandrii TaxID=288436 RepID=UPI0022AFA053|nr:hypothetical protein [Hoeflea alexandrii]MCZ4291534.1 hypothetical protein [Hoeflea alexandrii]
MRRREMIAGLGCAVLWGGHAMAQTSGGKRSEDIAREIFAHNIQVSLGLAPSSFEVHPPSGLEDAGYHAALKTGPLYAWTAVDAKLTALVNGFAGAGPGTQIAFGGFKGGIGHPGGLSALMEAMNFLDPPNRMPIDDIVKRVSFCLNRTDRAEFLFDGDVMRGSGFETPAAVRPPAVRTQRAHVTLTYFTMVQGLTGTFDVWKIVATVATGYAVIVTRQEIGW